MTHTTQASGSTAAAARSLWSILAAVAAAAVTHAFDFGAVAFGVAGIVAVLLVMLVRRYRRTGARVWLAVYGVLNAWIIVGFGIVGGFWNHTVKVAVAAAHGGALPPSLEGAFTPPEFGPAAYEATWMLLFVASVVAAWLGYRFARTVPWSRQASTPIAEAQP